MNIFLPVVNLIKNSLLAHEIIHGIVALPFALLLWKKTKSKKLVAIVFISTYLIDLDHLFDYLAFYGFRFNLFEFLNGKQFELSQKVYLPFHAWEWLVVLGIISKLRGWKSKYAAIILGILPHLLFDAIIWNHFLLYSIIYRAVNNFTFY